MITGCAVGFYGGNPLKLVAEDLPALQPTHFPSVPRLYNKIYGSIQEKFAAATGCKAWLLNKAVATKTAAFKKDNTIVNGCYDKLVFKKVRALLGGNVKMMITGSAPISIDVLNFIKICFSVNLCQGYGLTETSGGSVAQYGSDTSSGTCGGPVANVKVKLRSIPEMNYHANVDPTKENPRGEVMLTGSSVMKSYFLNEEKTNEMLPDGKWLCTGDVGEVFPNGALKIIDRAKNIFKLSQGEYIAPEKLEGMFVQSKYAAQVWVHGDSLRDYAITFIVLEEPVVKGLWGDNWKDEVNKPERKKEVLADLYRLAVENNLNSLEKPKNITLLAEPFSVENDMLTPTFKLKRNISKEVFKAEIEAMYNEPIIDMKNEKTKK